MNTRGARGQGAAHALHFARNEYTVYALDILEDAATELLDAARAEGLDVRFRKLDVSSKEDWTGPAPHIESEHGSVDALVNKSGMTHVAGIEDETKQRFKHVLQVNVVEPMLGMRAMWKRFCDRLPGVLSAQERRARPHEVRINGGCRCRGEHPGELCVAGSGADADAR